MFNCCSACSYQLEQYKEKQMEEMVRAKSALRLIDKARRAGVQRGINASVQTLENLRSLHSKGSSGYNDLTKAILTIQALDIDEVEC